MVVPQSNACPNKLLYPHDMMLTDGCRSETDLQVNNVGSDWPTDPCNDGTGTERLTAIITTLVTFNRKNSLEDNECRNYYYYLFNFFFTVSHEKCTAVQDWITTLPKGTEIVVKCIFLGSTVVEVQPAAAAA